MATHSADYRTEDLRSFIEVATTGHLTEAAENMGIPQPTLSRRIARVEACVGAQLFERGGRRLLLNTRGQAFLEHAHRIVAAVDDATHHIKRLMDPELGAIRLDFMHSLGTWMVPELIRTFRLSYPRVEFDLHQDAARHLVDRVLDDSSDLALVGPKPPEVGTELGWVPLLRQRVGLAVPVEHPLAGTGSIPLSAARDEPFVAMLPGFGTRLILDAMMEEAGFSPEIVFESMELTTVAGLVSAGLGVAILPLDDPYLAIGGVCTRPIEPAAYRELGLVWRVEAGPAPAVEVFREFVASSRFKEPAEAVSPASDLGQQPG